MKTILEFQGEYRFLSNFWPSYFEYQKIVYPTVEHAYQASKVGSMYIKTRIKNCDTPAAAKDYLQTHGIKPGFRWTIAKKLEVMAELLRIKFGGKDPFLTRALLATGDAVLIEGNTWNDTFWGVSNGTGENHLGSLLVRVREDLLRQRQRIIFQLKKVPSNTAIAEALSISQRELYEKMVAFKIKNKEFWIS